MNIWPPTLHQGRGECVICLSMLYSPAIIHEREGATRLQENFKSLLAVTSGGKKKKDPVLPPAPAPDGLVCRPPLVPH